MSISKEERLALEELLRTETSSNTEPEYMDMSQKTEAEVIFQKLSTEDMSKADYNALLVKWCAVALQAPVVLLQDPFYKSDAHWHLFCAQFTTTTTAIHRPSSPPAHFSS